MKRLLAVCSIAALFGTAAVAQTQTGSMSSPMAPSQGSMAQPAAPGPMSSGQMGGQAMKTHKKPQPSDAMAGGHMSAPANAGAMGGQPTNSSNSMSSPH